jgi:hypothetical protein
MPSAPQPHHLAHDLICLVFTTCRLLAKHTLQTGLTAKTNTQNEELVKANEVLAKENGRLAEQVREGGSRSRMRSGESREGMEGGRHTLCRTTVSP